MSVGVGEVLQLQVARPHPSTFSGCTGGGARLGIRKSANLNLLRQEIEQATLSTVGRVPHGGLSANHPVLGDILAISMLQVPNAQIFTAYMSAVVFQRATHLGKETVLT